MMQNIFTFFLPTFRLKRSFLPSKGHFVRLFSGIFLCNIFYIFFHFSTSFAQNIPFNFDNTPEVYIEGKKLSSPWCGGLNAPQFSNIDLNGDGTEDLLVFDRAAALLHTFIAEQKEWRYAPEYKQFFPKIENWVLARDYDGDGKKDLLTCTYAGVSVWKNVGAKNPAFRQIKNSLQTTGRTGDKINLLIDLSDIPSWIDADSDGDLDMINFVPSTGYSIEYHQNMSREKYGHADSLDFEKKDFEWGGLIECACGVYFFGTSSCRTERVMHAGSSITAYDSDKDGDMDIFVGEVSCDEVFFFNNKGNQKSAVFNAVGTMPTDKKINLPTFPASYFLDADFDGNEDLLVAPNLFYNENNRVNMRESAWLFTGNSGAQADFSFQKSNFLQENMLDVGENARIFPFDTDGDGDTDFLLGNAGSGFQDVYLSEIQHFENTGTEQNPAYVLKEKNWLGLQSLQLSQLVLRFEDADGDGKNDIFVSGYDVKKSEMQFFYVKNESTNGKPIFDLNKKISFNFPLSVYDEVLFRDFTGDKKSDILLTKYQGGADLYENKGALNFVLRKTNFAGIENNTQKRLLNGVFSDFDLDNKTDLLTGNQSGELLIYFNIDKGLTENILPQKLVWEKNPALTTAQVLGRGLFPALAGSKILVGSAAGGVFCLQTAKNVTGTDEEEAFFLQIYPNPSSDKFNISLSESAQVQIFSSVGVLLFEKNFETKGIFETGENLPSGLYFLHCRLNNGRKIMKKIIKN